MYVILVKGDALDRDSSCSEKSIIYTPCSLNFVCVILLTTWILAHCDLAHLSCNDGWYPNVLICVIPVPVFVPIHAHTHICVSVPY